MHLKFDLKLKGFASNVGKLQMTHSYESWTQGLTK